jgi:SHS2 domain-containing protein
MSTWQSWEEVDHTADWALHVWGEDLRSLFENAARGMVSLMEGVADQVQTPVERSLMLEAPDLEILLVNWLAALLTIIEDEGIVFSAISVEDISDLSLRARVVGRPGGECKKYIKAVTFHNLSVSRTAEGYETTVVFDV